MGDGFEKRPHDHAESSTDVLHDTGASPEGVPSTFDVELIREVGLDDLEAHEYLYTYINHYGWEVFFDELKENPSENLDILQYSLRRFGDFSKLSNETLDSLIERVPNGIIYSLLRGANERRRQSEEFVRTASRGDIVILLGENGHQYYDEVALKEKSPRIFQHSPKLKEEAIQKQLSWNEAQGIYDDHEGVLDMSDEELLEWIAPAYQLEMITDYCVESIGGVYKEELWMASSDKQELYDPVIFSDELLRENALQALHQDQGVFDNVVEVMKHFRQEDFAALEDNALAARIFPHLYKAAEEELVGGGAEQLAQFVSHTTILQVSKDMYVSFDPHGRFIQVVQMDQDQEGTVVSKEERMPIQVASHLATMVFKGSHISPTGTAAALLVNWKFFPKDIQQEASALGLAPYEGGLHMFFDQACFHAEQLGYLEKLTPNFLNRLADRFNTDIGAAYEDFDYTKGVVTEEKLHNFLISHYGHELISAQDLSKLLTLCTPELIQSLEGTLRIPMTSLTTREMLAVTSYLQKCNGGSTCFGTIENILGESEDTARTHRLKIFVAQQSGALDLGDVLRLNTLGSSGERDYVYEKFAELLDSSEDTKVAGEQMGLAPEELRIMGNRLVGRAAGLLREASVDIGNTIRRLEFISSDAALFASGFKSLTERGDVDLDDIRGASLERIPSNEITPEDRAQMAEIWEFHYGQKYTEALRTELRNEFTDSFSEENIQYYLYHHHDNVVSFSRSEVVGVSEDGLTRKHRGSLMTNPAYEGGAVGLAFFKRVLAEDLKGSVLEAECDADPEKTPVVSKYFEEYGYVASAYREDDGEPTLVLRQKEGEVYRSKQMTQGEIRAYANAETQGPIRCVRSESVPPHFTHGMQDGFVMTRYFVEKIKNQDDPTKEVSVYYAAFEASASVRNGMP